MPHFFAAGWCRHTTRVTEVATLLICVDTLYQVIDGLNVAFWTCRDMQLLGSTVLRLTAI